MRTVRTALAPFLVATWLSGCPGGDVDDPLSRIIVQDAHLEDAWLSNLGAVVGGGNGECDLVVNDIDGERHVFPSTLGTRSLGLSLDASVLLTFGDVDFTVSPGDLTARDLVGAYSGLHVGGGVILGGHWRDMKHVDSGAKLAFASMSVGLGVVPLTWEDMALRLVNDPIRFLDGGAAPCNEDVDCADDGTVCQEDVGFCVPAEPVRDRARTPPALPSPQRNL